MKTWGKHKIKHEEEFGCTSKKFLNVYQLVMKEQEGEWQTKLCHRLVTCDTRAWLMRPDTSWNKYYQPILITQIMIRIILTN